MSQNKTVTGTCLCKSVSLSFTLDQAHFAACHCDICKNWIGGPALSVQGGPDLKIEGESFVSTYSSSAWAERGFCKQCGTHLFYRLKDKSYINFPIGLLKGAEDLKFGLQIFIDKKAKNYSFANETKNMTEAEFLAQFS